MSSYAFAPFVLDLRAGRLSREATPIPLRPKTFAVLQYLVEHRGELVTKAALLGAVWGDVAVSEDVVRLSVGELRTALGDARGAPRFIETVPRRGYRFLAPVVAAGHAPGGAASEPTIAPMVGRDDERAQILEVLRLANSGRRQVVFVAGEAGIGKTTLVDAVLGSLRGTTTRVARGQCVEQYGSGEPFLPVLEAIEELRRGPLGPALQEALRGTAPAWLLRAIQLQPTGGKDPLGSSVDAPEHALHALAAGLDGLAAETPLVLVLEDVHWIDHSTLDLLSLLAQRRQPARLTVICTLRPADAIAHGHPVVQARRELARKGLCRELRLGGLGADDVSRYLTARFSGATVDADLLPLLVARSEGNPFFIGTLVDHLVDRELLVEHEGRWELRERDESLRTAIPEGLRALIDPRLERLADDEATILGAASVAGSEFGADIVARIVPPESALADVVHVERACDALVRRQEILRARDATAAHDGTHYEFRHAIYQQAIYQRLTASQRRRLHRAAGEALAALHGDRTTEIAAALAAHFERGGDVERAVRFHREAAAHARSRSAYRETRLHLEAALALLVTRDETPDRLREEVSLLQELGVTMFAIKGYAHEDGARVFARIRELAERMDGGGFAHYQAMEGLLVVHTMRAEFSVARALGEELIVLAERLGDDTAAANTHVTHSATLYGMAEAEASYHHADRARTLLDPEAPAAAADIGILAYVQLASTSAYLGRLAHARAFKGEILKRADKLDTAFHRSFANCLAAGVCMVLDDVAESRSHAEEAIRLADEYDFSPLRIMATMFRGWCDVEDGHVAAGLADLRAAFQEHVATGQLFGMTCYSMMLARAHLAHGDVASADEVVDASLRFAERTGERTYEPEFHRLKGECLLARSGRRRPSKHITQAFERALAIADERRGLLFGLRAATSLCRVVGAPARPRLAKIVARFAAADDGPNLRAARALL